MHRPNKKSKSRGKIIWDEEPLQDEEGVWYLYGTTEDGQTVWKEPEFPSDPSQIRDHEDQENEAFNTFEGSSSFQPGSPDTPPRYRYNQPYATAGRHNPVQTFPRENPPDEALYDGTTATNLDQHNPVEDDGLVHQAEFPPLGLVSEVAEGMHSTVEHPEEYDEDDNGEEIQDEDDEDEDSEEHDEPAQPIRTTSHSSKHATDRSHKDTTSSSSKDATSRSGRKSSKSESDPKSSRSKGKEPAKSHGHHSERKERGQSDRKDRDGKGHKKESRRSRDNNESESRRSRKDFKDPGKDAHKASRVDKGKGRADDREGGDYGYDHSSHGGDARQFGHGPGLVPLQPIPIRPGQGAFSPSMPPVLEHPFQGTLGMPGRAETGELYPEESIGSWPDSTDMADPLDVDAEDDDDEVQRVMKESQDDYYQPVREGGPSSGPSYEQVDVDRSGSQTPRPLRDYGVHVGKSDLIKGTKGDAEPLDRRYKIFQSWDFSPGSVFKVLWFEPKGKPIGGGSKVSELVRVSDAKKDFYVGFRRFIVVANDEGHCTCVPILTYGRQGCNKPGVKAKQHGIIYLEQPHRYVQKLPGEPDLGFPPVRVVIEARNETISEESRVNYSKLVNVEHNVKVFFIGCIHHEDSHIVQDAVDKCWDRKNKKQRRDR